MRRERTHRPGIAVAMWTDCVIAAYQLEEVVDKQVGLDQLEPARRGNRLKGHGRSDERCDRGKYVE